MGLDASQLAVSIRRFRVRRFPPIKSVCRCEELVRPSSALGTSSSRADIVLGCQVFVGCGVEVVPVAEVVQLPTCFLHYLPEAIAVSGKSLDGLDGLVLTI